MTPRVVYVNEQFVTHVCAVGFAVRPFSYHDSNGRRTLHAMLTRPRLLAIAALYVAVSLLQVQCAPARPQQEPLVVATGQGRAFTDITSDAGGARLKVPAKPEPWQTTPPCKRGEHALNGACYQRYTKEDMAPPCDAGIYEYDGQCWRAVARAPREPSSIQR